MDLDISPYTVYAVGAAMAVVAGGMWSFVFDKNKPSTAGEFIAKLIARILFFLLIFAVLMGFLYLAFGVFR